MDFSPAPRKFTQSIYSGPIRPHLSSSTILSFLKKWLPRSALPAIIWLGGKMGTWLGGSTEESVARQPQGQEILTDQQPFSVRYGVSFRGQARPYFSPHSAGIWACGALFYSLLCFFRPTAPCSQLHRQKRASQRCGVGSSSAQQQQYACQEEALRGQLAKAPGQQ